MGLTKGESAPALCDSKGNPAVTHHGKPITLAEYAGKRVVIWFFPRASTEGCTAEGDGFKSLLPKFEEKNVAIIGCSNDPVEKNAEFADKQGYTFPLICDTDLAVSVAYHAAPDPSAGKANRVAVLIDPSGNVEEYFGQVDPKEFPEQLLGKL